MSAVEPSVAAVGASSAATLAVAFAVCLRAPRLRRGGPPPRGGLTEKLAVDDESFSVMRRATASIAPGDRRVVVDPDTAQDPRAHLVPVRLGEEQVRVPEHVDGTAGGGRETSCPHRQHH